MKRAFACLAFAALAGCQHTVTLYPRGGGSQATGTLNDGSQNMAVTLGGETYTGRYVKGRMSGVMTSYGYRTGAAAGTMHASSNQATAVLTGPKGVVRCDLVIDIISGGNGVCVDPHNVVYDIVIKQ